MNDPKVKRSGRGKDAQPLIYVVDDEPMLLELAAVILEPMGYKVETFRDAESAIKAFASTQAKPALVITDFQMHAMSGMALIEACRRLQPRQKLLLVSGTVDERIYMESDSKPDLFLAKPYQARQLENAVKKLLGH
jgi:DNA-binding NtrC family response regulator